MKKILSISNYKAKKIVKCVKGVSAIEFAMIAPILVAAYLGTVEISNAIAIDRKLTIASFTLANLTGQYEVVQDADIDDFFSATEQVLFPFNDLNIGMTITSVKIDEDGELEVVWTETHNNGPVHNDGNIGNLVPEDQRRPDSSVIVTEVTHSYTPTFYNSVINQVNLEEVTIAVPRLVDIVCKDDQSETQCSI